MSLDQLAKFRQGSLSGAELLAADDHLSGCAECREQMAELSADSCWTDLARQLPRAAGEPHVPYELLQSYAEGHCSAADASLLEGHFATCSSCRAEADDLKAFAAEFRKRHSPMGRIRQYLFLGPVAAALLVGALLIPRSTQPPVLAVSLIDGGKRIGLDSAGTVVGAHGAGGLDSGAIADALREGRIAAVLPEGLRGKRSVLLGPPGPEAGFQVLRPAGEPVLNSSVEFNWSPLAGAAAYQVQVFDSEYHAVLASPRIAGTAWVSALPRGQQYVWQVTAYRDGTTVTAPQPPEAEARFLVLAEPDAGAVEQARRGGAGHLVMSLVYAHAGLCREAAGEIDALGKENSGSAVVDRLRAALTSQCEAAGKR